MLVIDGRWVVDLRLAREVCHLELEMIMTNEADERKKLYGQTVGGAKQKIDRYALNKQSDLHVRVSELTLPCPWTAEKDLSRHNLTRTFASNSLRASS